MNVVFLNPANHNQLYINIGWNTSGSQRYPPYHAGMVSFLPQAQEELIHAAKQQFENPPVSHFCVGCCAMYSCLFTCGVFFCPILYLKRKVDAFNKDASATIAAAAAQAGDSAKLDMVQSASESGRSW